MDCLRRYVRRVEWNNKRTEEQITKLEPYKGSRFYEEESDRIRADAEKTRSTLKEGVQRELVPFLDSMRQNCKKRITKAPTAEQVATLDMLEKIDNLTVKDVELYAAEMMETPLAMRRLQQIAHASGIQLNVADPSVMLDAVDHVDGVLYQFVSNFKGDTEHSVSVIEKTLYPFLTLDETSVTETPYKSLEKVDRGLWEQVFLDGTGIPLDALEGKTPAPKVYLFFKDVKSLSEYISKKTEGLNGPDATKKENEILQECPDQYGAALRWYRGHGEEIPLENIG